MTVEELREACANIRKNYELAGLDPDDAHVVLVVPGKMRRPGTRRRVAPGLYGRVVGDTADGQSVIVDCTVIDVERSLLGVTS